jgi:hypothetical protein
MYISPAGVARKVIGQKALVVGSKLGLNSRYVRRDTKNARVFVEPDPPLHPDRTASSSISRFTEGRAGGGSRAGSCN